MVAIDSHPDNLILLITHHLLFHVLWLRYLIQLFSCGVCVLFGVLRLKMSECGRRCPPWTDQKRNKQPKWEKRALNGPCPQHRHRKFQNLHYFMAAWVGRVQCIRWGTVCSYVSVALQWRRMASQCAQSDKYKTEMCKFEPTRVSVVGGGVSLSNCCRHIAYECLSWHQFVFYLYSCFFFFFLFVHLFRLFVRFQRFLCAALQISLHRIAYIRDTRYTACLTRPRLCLCVNENMQSNITLIIAFLLFKWKRARFHDCTLYIIFFWFTFIVSPHCSRCMPMATAAATTTLATTGTVKSIRVHLT